MSTCKKRVDSLQLIFIFQILQEEDIFTRQYLWVLQPTTAHLNRFLMLVRRFGLIPPGGEERSQGPVRVPFISDVDAIQQIENYMKRTAPGQGSKE